MPVLTDGTNRTTRTPLQLGPHAIPAGTMVWVPFGATFGSARSWERADEYLPARPSVPLPCLSASHGQRAVLPGARRSAGTTRTPSTSSSHRAGRRPPAPMATAHSPAAPGAFSRSAWAGATASGRASRA